MGRNQLELTLIDLELTQMGMLDGGNQLELTQIDLELTQIGGKTIIPKTKQNKVLKHNYN